MKVYKSAGERNDYLVTLELTDTSDSNTNLSRKVDIPLFAKYRCKKAFVVSIEHKNTGKSVNFIESTYDSTFIYKVGEHISDKYYDANTNNICSRGIHFYKTKEQALYWQWQPVNGPYKRWYENGQLQLECGYKNDKLEGPYKWWYGNGKLSVEHGYKDGKLEGPYKSWHENGQISKEECEYEGGELIGPYKSWYPNGELIKENKFAPHSL